MAELDSGITLTQVQSMIAQAVAGAGSGVTQAQVNSTVATAISGLAIPQPATAAPPAVQVDSVTGTDSSYARANHTHESRLQARRMQMVFDANGEAVYTFPKAYGTGVLPIVQVTAENTRGASFRYDVTIRQDSTTATQTTVILSKTPRTLTASILGAVLNVFTNPADTVWINIMSRAPS